MKFLALADWCIEEVESRKAELLNREKAMSEAARNLEIIIGRYPSANTSPKVLPKLPPKPSIGAPEDVLKNRPDIIKLYFD